MAKKGSAKGKGKAAAVKAPPQPLTSGAEVGLDLDIDDAALAVGAATAVDEGAASLPEIDTGVPADEAAGGDDAEGGRRRTSVVNGTHVTVAFPFSKITNPEPSEELHALAALVADLVEALADAGIEGVAELQGRATELRERIAGLR